MQIFWSWLNHMADAALFAGASGMLLFGAVFFVLSLLCVPVTPLMAAAGFLFGPFWGSLTVMAASALSAWSAFALGRTAFYVRVRRWLLRHPLLATVERALSAQGWRTVFLLRLSSMIPFAPLSYALGAAKVKTRTFLSATLLGELPWALLYGYLGSLLNDLSQLADGHSLTASLPPYAYALMVGVMILAVLLLSRTARAALGRQQ
ncbi:MAG: VTT domain-containing protein [Neisseria sp.]|nr:VTT domain-containing protein [Neisseria sp.]